jgi:hypothetical protein
MSITTNQFKSTKIGGELTVQDNGGVNAKFTNARDRCLYGDLYIGNETATTTFTDTGGSIIFKLNGVTYAITTTILSYLSTLTSNVQAQLGCVTSGFVASASSATTLAAYLLLSSASSIY